MPESIANKIDDLLEKDPNFSTRAGVRFLTEVIRDAYAFIEDEKEYRKTVEDKQDNIDDRLTDVEKTLESFLAQRTKEQERAEIERTKWRWAIITPTIGLFFTTLGLLISIWLKP